jgi:hypothetical protein
MKWPPRQLFQSSSNASIRNPVSLVLFSPYRAGPPFRRKRGFPCLYNADSGHSSFCSASTAPTTITARVSIPPRHAHWVTSRDNLAWRRCCRWWPWQPIPSASTVFGTQPAPRNIRPVSAASSRTSHEPRPRPGQHCTEQRAARSVSPVNDQSVTWRPHGWAATR